MLEYQTASLVQGYGQIEKSSKMLGGDLMFKNIKLFLNRSVAVEINTIVYLDRLCAVVQPAARVVVHADMACIVGYAKGAPVFETVSRRFEGTLAEIYSSLFNMESVEYERRSSLRRSYWMDRYAFDDWNLVRECSDVVLSAFCDDRPTPLDTFEVGTNAGAPVNTWEVVTDEDGFTRLVRNEYHHVDGIPSGYTPHYMD